MKKLIALLTSSAMLLTGCSISGNKTEESSKESTQIEMNEQKQESIPGLSADCYSEEYVENLAFTSLDDEDLKRYFEDSVYSQLVDQLDSDEYFVENVEAVYISKEYLEEVEYNSKKNVYFGYALADLDEAFQGEKYIFTLDETGQTAVVPYEEYDDSFEKVARNVAVGTGVILICVTVSVVSAGVGAPAVSMIFAASAKSATTFALSSGVISGVSAGVVEGIKTHDFDEAVKAAALKGSEGFMWGACAGAVAGGAGEAIALKGATLNGLTMNEAAAIQKESKYPLDVIKEFSSMEQFEICQKAGLKPKMINGKTALIRDIDLDFIAKEAGGKTNYQLMLEGKAPFDPTGVKYELHHIGQKNDSTLAILTQEEHRLGDSYSIWHELIEGSEIDRNAFNTIRTDFWKDMAVILAA
ncbi:A nuclease of the HNH/ENDO VII superfamily with conserved LHH [Ruminococcus sp. YE71]|uniref:HNH/ENDO VII family nuclease n=1 Tax=unclassified Ruminococcus TaxID=2608920 RepID=UPI00088890A0|nr:MULTISPECIES: HNH/ENDO VII family nuclease [unclassified Ruminococcus]SDA20200.1 A nuclease of the HNH/ENDO VII superfamily with conserved LHH [Ruminococcus sp. YE78]SFW32008.1 A nuclease of the HNH/ENDO VII superfamily with conserved LHH [Ruminococcus sp. YE71]